MPIERAQAQMASHQIWKFEKKVRLSKDFLKMATVCFAPCCIDIGNSLGWFLSGLSPSMTQTHGSERLHHVHSHSIDNFSKKLKGFRKNPT